MKRIIKHFVAIMGVFLGLFIWYDQSRSFFKATNGEYVTMWKRYGGICYLIPGKYYWITRPVQNYIETENKASGDFIWANKSSKYVLFSSGKNYKIVNNDSTKITLINYSDDEKQNDSLYTEKKGDYSIYKKFNPFEY